MNFMFAVPQIKKPYLAIGPVRSVRCDLRSDDGNCLTLQHALGGKHHLAGDLGKQRVILAHADVLAGMELRAALAHDDAACIDQFAAVTLDTQSR